MDDKRRLILDQALALVDEQGLAAMSMRAVAERVGLTSMALYPYVGGKDALLDGLVDLLHLELGAAWGDPSEVDWRQRLRALGRAVRGLAHAHPGAFPLLLNRAAAGAAASWLVAAMRGVLHDAGVADGEVPRMARMICAFLLGFSTGEVTGGLPGSAGPTGRPTAKAGASAEQPPAAAEVDTGFPRAVTGAGDEPAGGRPDGGLSRAAAAASAERAGTVAGVGGKRTEAGPDGGLSRAAAAASAERAGTVAGGGGELAGVRLTEAREVGELVEGRAGVADGGPAGGEFDADLEDLVRLVEVSVRGR